MIADGAKHPRLKIPEGHGIRKAAGVNLSVVKTVRIAATDEHAVSSESAHIRERHRLVVEQEVRDRPGHRLSKCERGIGNTNGIGREQGSAAADRGC